MAAETAKLDSNDDFAAGSYAGQSGKFRLQNYERTFGSTKLSCTALVHSGTKQAAQMRKGLLCGNKRYLLYATERIGVPNLFQQIALVRGHYFARDMQLLLEGKTWLKVHIDRLEDLGTTGQQALTVPADAPPVTRRLFRTGEFTAGRLITKAPPEYPVAAKQQGVQDPASSTASSIRKAMCKNSRFSPVPHAAKAGPRCGEAVGLHTLFAGR